MNFNPNWICLELVVVAVRTPALEESCPARLKICLVVVLGAWKFGWLAMLKHSARNCRFFCSVIGKRFMTEKSTEAIPGPISVFRPRLPKVPSGCGTKAHGSKYKVGVPTGVPAATPVHPRDVPLV